ncbi:hypothetical protein G6F40_017596 [Rhizopus arrhizus]|nr:hypothetical protein G6F40_017596 [Rhizopus arrhizus]
MTTPYRILPLAAIGTALLLLASAVTAADAVLHPFLVAQPKQAPHEVNLAVEIPAGSFTNRCRSPILPTTVRCRVPWPVTTIRSMRWC